MWLFIPYRVHTRFEILKTRTNTKHFFEMPLEFDKNVLTFYRCERYWLKPESVKINKKLSTNKSGLIISKPVKRVCRKYGKKDQQNIFCKCCMSSLLVMPAVYPPTFNILQLCLKETWVFICHMQGRNPSEREIPTLLDVQHGVKCASLAGNTVVL